MVKITEDFKIALKKHIEEIENKSPIEIVPVIVKKASEYHSWSLIYGLFFSHLFVEFVLKPYIPWNSFHAALNFGFFVLFALLFAKTLQVSNLLKYILPKNVQLQATQQRASELFISESVFETSNRLGILISVFESEKSVIILADKGFKTHIEDNYWHELGKKLAADFDRKNAGDEFFQALSEIEKDVMNKFKIVQENQNELPDHLRKR